MISNWSLTLASLMDVLIERDFTEMMSSHREESTAGREGKDEEEENPSKGNLTLLLCDEHEHAVDVVRIFEHFATCACEILDVN